MIAPFRQWLAREGRMLLATLVVLLLAWGFSALAGEMTEGDTGAADKAIMLALRQPHDLSQPIGPAFVRTMAIDLTALGSETILTLVTMAAVAFLFVRRRWRHALLLAGAVAGGAIISGLLKTEFARPRPQIVPHLVEVSSGSFPSGHAMNSAIVYLTIAVLVARGYREAGTRIFVVSAAVIATLLIGATRVVLGVHYPSDVAAGWLVGGAWAVAMSALGTRLQRGHKIEDPAAPKGTAPPAPTAG